MQIAWLRFYRYKPGFFVRCFAFSRAARLKVCSKFSSKGSTFDTLVSRPTLGLSDFLAEALETVEFELVLLFIAVSRFSNYICTKFANRKATDLVPKMVEFSCLLRANCVEKLGFHLKTAKNFITERQLEILARGAAKSIVWRCM